jgi:hypothetical protein
MRQDSVQLSESVWTKLTQLAAKRRASCHPISRYLTGCIQLPQLEEAKNGMQTITKECCRSIRVWLLLAQRSGRHLDVQRQEEERW